MSILAPSKKQWRIIVICAIVTVIIIYTLFEHFNDPVKQGEKLAKQYCGSCHKLPPPEALTKKSWDYLLTYMGFRLGIVDYQYLKGSSNVVLDNIKSKEKTLRVTGQVPDKQVLSDSEWKTLRQYYNTFAPESSLPQPAKEKISEELPQFEIRIPDHQPKGAVTTLLRIDEDNQRILIGDNNTESITFLDKKLNVIKQHFGYELVVDAEITGDSIYFLSIGDLMGRYVGMSRGYIMLCTGNSENMNLSSYVLGDLHRPVDMEFADLDNSGKKQVIICNFGDVSGNVSLFKPNGDKFSLTQNISNMAGPVKCRAADFNQDGLVDIAVLFSDARENLSTFMNLGNNTFEQKMVVEGNSAYGNTYFEIQDFNSDGFLDLMTVNGDSDADPYNTLKNYHGIRIYLNDGKNNFKERYLYPMYGVHFAKAYDFDQDGDLDIAAVSFFPDFNQTKPEIFTYLRNKGDFNFETFTHPETYSGRWMVMDIGDYDNDNDIDIVIGGSYIPLGMAVNHMDKFHAMRTSGKAILVFENKLH